MTCELRLEFGSGAQRLRGQDRQFGVVRKHLVDVVVMQSRYQGLAYGAEGDRHLVANVGRQAYRGVPFIAGKIDDVCSVQHRDPDSFTRQRRSLFTEPVELLDLVEAAEVRRTQLNQFAAEGELRALAVDKPGLLEREQEVGG